MLWLTSRTTPRLTGTRPRSNWVMRWGRPVLDDLEFVAGQIADQASLGVAHGGRHLDQVDAGAEPGHDPALLARRRGAGDEHEKRQRAGEASERDGSRAVEHDLLLCRAGGLIIITVP